MALIREQASSNEKDATSDLFGIESLLIHRFRELDSREATRGAAKIALCVEGGGMRGVISGGMLAALSTFGLLECFDTVYGVSAGAINAAYCYSGQIDEGLTIYFRHINNPRFFTLHRMFSGDLIDLDYLTTTVMSSLCRLDARALAGRRTQVRAVVLDTEQQRTLALPVTTSHRSAIRVLRAAVTIAGCVAPPKYMNGARFADASTVDPTGYDCAQRDGFEYALVLLSRPTTEPPARHGLLERVLLGPRLAKWPAAVRKAVETRGKAYIESVARLEGAMRVSPRKVALIQPERSISTFETRRSHLSAAFEEGYTAAESRIRGWMDSY